MTVDPQFSDDSPVRWALRVQPVDVSPSFWFEPLEPFLHASCAESLSAAIVFANASNLANVQMNLPPIFVVAPYALDSSVHEFALRLQYGRSSAWSRPIRTFSGPREALPIVGRCNAEFFSHRIPALFCVTPYVPGPPPLADLESSCVQAIADMAPSVPSFSAIAALNRP